MKTRSRSPIEGMDGRTLPRRQSEEITQHERKESIHGIES